MSERCELGDHVHMLSVQDRAWLEFRDAVNAGIDAEEAAADADREAQEARLHGEWLVARRASAEQECAIRRPAHGGDRIPLVVGGGSPVLAKSDALGDAIKA